MDGGCFRRVGLINRSSVRGACGVQMGSKMKRSAAERVSFLDCRRWEEVVVVEVVVEGGDGGGVGTRLHVEWVGGDLGTEKVIRQAHGGGNSGDSRTRRILKK